MSKDIEKQYLKLLKDILENGVEKQDRTGTGTISVFGRQIRHDMSKGFPLLTTKKMYWKGIVTELLWFLRGDTNIKYLVDNDCHIWDGDAFREYKLKCEKERDDLVARGALVDYQEPTMEAFVDAIKNGDKFTGETAEQFAEKHGDLGPIYGKQWRDWEYYCGGGDCNVDQISNLIEQLKTNPNSRRLMVNAWNVGELDQMTLPPCHYGFQVYTRELTFEERTRLYNKTLGEGFENKKWLPNEDFIESRLKTDNIPTRSISLMWNQRSVDTFLGLPFNIASYGLLLEIIAKEVNMVPDELIGNLGDVHLYKNHIDQAKEQLTREPMGLSDVRLRNYENLESLLNTKDSMKNIQLWHYDSHPLIKAPLSN